MNDDTVCRGSIFLGSGCGKCKKCKSDAFDWICKNLSVVDYWAVMVTGQHDVMKAVIKQAKVMR